MGIVRHTKEIEPAKHNIRTTIQNLHQQQWFLLVNRFEREEEPFAYSAARLYILLQALKITVRPTSPNPGESFMLKELIEGILK